MPPVALWLVGQRGGWAGARAMSKNVDAVHAWIRSTFVDLNPALEEL